LIFFPSVRFSVLQEGEVSSTKHLIISKFLDDLLSILLSLRPSLNPEYSLGHSPLDGHVLGHTSISARALAHGEVLVPVVLDALVPTSPQNSATDILKLNLIYDDLNASFVPIIEVHLYGDEFGGSEHIFPLLLAQTCG
jgi:hypothetical protein